MGLSLPNVRVARLLVAFAAAVGLSLVGAAPAEGSTVRITAGSNLTQIAHTYGTTVAALAAANGITNPNLIVIGTVLQVPSTTAAQTAAPAKSSTVVTVASGDSLWSIATRYGVSVNALASANNMKLSSMLLIGAHLAIPGKSAPAATAPTSTATTWTTPKAALASHPSRQALVPLFRQWAARYNVPTSLLEGMCWWESGWQMAVVSSTGAVGIGQLEPATVVTMRGVIGDQSLSATNTSDNIEMAAAYLHLLLTETGGSQSLSLASYYQGFVSVQQHGMLPSTQQYVHGVLATAKQFA